MSVNHNENLHHNEAIEGLKTIASGSRSGKSFLIKCAKLINQQNEEIKQLTHFLKVSNEIVDYKNKRLERLEDLLEQSPNFKNLSIQLANEKQRNEKVLEENERLQNLVQSLTEKNQSLGERDANAADH